ncbi:MAG: DUF4954 family protein [Bacteroidaceae bacterium]|nr:DUF4954 family protein [Bacteroidaceae bacterium]
MRNLTETEISALERNGCTADDWGCVTVADSFSTDDNRIRNVEFCGCVKLGCYDAIVETDGGARRKSGIYNACLENVSVGDNAYIRNVGLIRSQKSARTAWGRRIAVLCESGSDNVVLHPQLSAQEAAMMVQYSDRMQDYMDGISAEGSRSLDGFARIGNETVIVNTQSVVNSNIGSNTKIINATRIEGCEISDGATVGDNVICCNSIVCRSASVQSGATVESCFVGEAVEISSYFSATNSLFFANCIMSNGEACAAFCGPFTVSHHRSSLLIGGMYSFYNAGSGTNYSNHAYKSGAVHYGFMRRGAKTASGAHILWPAEIPPFTMVMGKVESHPKLADFAFSYLIADGGKLWLVPGVNFATLGTYRDVSKWPKRDERIGNEGIDQIEYDFLHPYILQKVMRASAILKEWESACTGDVYAIDKKTYIRRSAILKGIKYYDYVLKMGFGLYPNIDRLKDVCAAADSVEWADVQGLFLPSERVERIALSARNPQEMKKLVNQAKNDSILVSDSWMASAMMRFYNLTEIDGKTIEKAKRDAMEARSEWIELIKEDAKKESALGDIPATALNATLASIK